MTNSRVALVTGASRGAGAGIARGFGELGYTVYVTGRTITPGEAKGWGGTVLSGTVSETAQAVTERGGKGIPVICDHADDAAVAKLFAQIQEEVGRLDVLVNNATYIDDQLVEPKPFWEKGLDAQKILDVGTRSAYVASWHAARMMVPRGAGCIAMISSYGATCYMHGPAYGGHKAALDKMAHDMEHDLRGTGVIAVSLWLGMQLTERAQILADARPDEYAEFVKMYENPEFTSHVLNAIDEHPERDDLSGQSLIVAEIARSLGLKDRGQDRPSYAETLGRPRPKNSAAVY